MTRTYVDAGVLIAAATGRQPDVQPVAIAVLDDEERTFLSSAFVRLEVLPKALHGRRAVEVGFYRAYFDAVTAWSNPVGDVSAAFDLAARYGFNGMDALHVAAALSLSADEFVTTERPSSPIFRIAGIRVVSIRPATPGGPVVSP